ncbi:hypothetical protein [Thermoactinospora rubra]|uniref:hypothetical protein n=1 Tax=Thermoactinospora rubra TaxID=1088767 RepID=UPI000A11CCEB|nr:hypothetical protein [Thermoactinospora rubra]
MTARRVAVVRRQATLGRPPGREWGNGPDHALARALEAAPGVPGLEETRHADVTAVLAGQLRASLPTLAAVFGALVGLPVLVALLGPGSVWLSLAAHPIWVALAVLHLNRAERLERCSPPR